MRTTWKWLKRGIGVAYVLLVGLVGGVGGRVIVDRRDMYGDDPANDPYSTEFEPEGRRRR
jgi:hypothetical protein